MDERAFSPERVWKHFETLADLGPRPAGSGQSRRAREYLREQLAVLGIEVREQNFELDAGVESVEVTHLIAELPGESNDLVLMAAPYDAAAVADRRGGGANEGASGSALLLELARVLVASARPYTIWLVLLEGDSLESSADAPHFSGSDALAEAFAEDGTLDRVRLALFFDRVADRDLAIARDLRSHRIYREVFFASARALGREAAFPAEASLASPPASHRSFLDRGLRQIVAFVDERYGAGDPPGDYWRSDEDTVENCAAASLETVGLVALEGLDRISARLAKIDHFPGSTVELEVLSPPEAAASTPQPSIPDVE